jgi:hypothetical protein
MLHRESVGLFKDMEAWFPPWIFYTSKIKSPQKQVMHSEIPIDAFKNEYSEDNLHKKVVNNTSKDTEAYFNHELIYEKTSQNSFQNQIKSHNDPDHINTYALLPPIFPWTEKTYEISCEERDHLLKGQWINIDLTEISFFETTMIEGTWIACIYKGNIVALTQYYGEKLYPKRVFLPFHTSSGGL